MTKEEAIQYFKDHNEEIIDLCTELNLHFPYENREKVLEYYHDLKDSKTHFAEWAKKEEDQTRKASYMDKFRKLKDMCDDMEKTYHIFEPEFNAAYESRWIPKQYNQDAHEIFAFRKDMFATQDIYKDMELTNIIRADMGSIWDRFGGQDGMYENFPITITYKDTVHEYDYVNPFYDGNNPAFSTKVYHYKCEMIRSYCLDSSGGVAIIENRLHTKYDDNPKDYVSSNFQIVSLGEDDGYHFLNCATIYEHVCSENPDSFIEMVHMAVEEYEKFVKSEKTEN